MTTTGASSNQSVNVHGTTLALGDTAVMIIGPSGAGKSDLALRCLNAPPGPMIPLTARLVSDDQTLLERDGERIYASAPASIQGLLEVRGVGLVHAEICARARLVLIADLTTPNLGERLPPDPLPTVDILDLPVARISLAAFEASAPAKLLLALSLQSDRMATNDLP